MCLLLHCPSCMPTKVIAGCCRRHHVFIGWHGTPHVVKGSVLPCRSWRVFAGWGRYLAIALPGLAALCLEWWTFEIIVMLAGGLPGKDAEVSVSVMGVSFDVTTIAYMLPAGIGGALCNAVHAWSDISTSTPKQQQYVVVFSQPRIQCRMNARIVAGSGYKLKEEQCILVVEGTCSRAFCGRGTLEKQLLEVLCGYVPAGAISTRVSTNMGAGNWRCARLAVHIALALAALTVTSTSIAILAGRSLWPRIFTQDARVVALTAQVLPILALSSIFDGFVSVFRGGFLPRHLHAETLHATGNRHVLGGHAQVACCGSLAAQSWWHAGVLTGTGRQLVGAGVAFGAYWCCGIPLALLLSFKLDYGVQGLWLALLVASGLVCLADSAFLGRLDWSKEADRIRSGMEREQDDEAGGSPPGEEAGSQTKLLASEDAGRTPV